MTQPENAPAAVIAVCPHCQKTYSVRPEHLGRTTQCRGCGQQFQIVARDAAPAPHDHRPKPAPAPAVATLAQPAAAPRAAQPDASVLCPVCQSPFGPGDQVTACPDCGARHHTDCWEYNRGCSLYGCKQAPATDKLQDIEVPASYWGQTQKSCPKCRQVIQAAATRCRFCGTTFESARPQESSEFHAQQRGKESLVIHRRFGIVLLVAALLPCTAPLAAVVGGIWYLTSRKSIAALPPLNATICRLAVGIAVGVTVLMTIVGVIYSYNH